MEFQDALLALTSYPEPTPGDVVDEATALAGILGTKLSALMFVLTRSRVARKYSPAEWLIDVPKLIDQAISDSVRKANESLDRFERDAKAAGIFQSRLLEHSTVFPSGDAVVRHARLRDITFVPVPDPIGLDELYAESIIFGSGRPTILLPAYSDRRKRPPSIKTVAVAWDFSRAAARAMADAMPILKSAKEVRVFTVTNEKDIEGDLQTAELEEHLKSHGIGAKLELIDAGGHKIGNVMAEYVTAHDVDMLVMGAFGHSRLIEFVLGGATRSIVNRPPIPVFLSH